MAPKFKQLTPNQLATLKYVREFRKLNQVSPTYMEIAGHFGISKIAAYERCLQLVEKGYLVARHRARARNLEVVSEGAYCSHCGRGERG